jgi:hypothetical protein
MINISYTGRYEKDVMTLKFDHAPNSTGIHTDVEGNKWDVNAYFGRKNRPYILARPVDDLSRYRTDTTPSSTTATIGSDVESYYWIPYYFEVVR